MAFLFVDIQNKKFSTVLPPSSNGNIAETIVVQSFSFNVKTITTTNPVYKIHW